MIRFLFSFLFLILCGCQPEKHTVEIPRKILSLSAAATGILTELGAPPAAIDSYGLIAAGTPTPAVIGKGSALSREKLCEAGIDCVILWSYQQDVVSMCRKAGIRTVELPSLRLNSYPALVLRLGELTGKQEKASELCRNFESVCSGLSPESQTIPVYFELYAPWKSAGRESYIGDLLQTSGGKSVTEKTGLINTESIIALSPEVIFYVEGFTSPDEISKRPGFSGIPAVKNHRIYSVSRRLITEGIAPAEAVNFFRNHLNRSL